MTLPAFTVERCRPRGLRGACALAAGRRRWPLSIGISCPHGAQQQTRLTPLLSIDGTYGRTLDRFITPSSAYYAGTPSKHEDVGHTNPGTRRSARRRVDIVCSLARRRTDVGPMRRGVGPTSSCLLGISVNNAGTCTKYKVEHNIQGLPICKNNTIGYYTYRRACYAHITQSRLCCANITHATSMVITYSNMASELHVIPTARLRQPCPSLPVRA